jgi:hypothetical protein
MKEEKRRLHSNRLGYINRQTMECYDGDVGGPRSLSNCDGEELMGLQGGHYLNAFGLIQRH